MLVASQVFIFFGLVGLVASTVPMAASRIDLSGLERPLQKRMMRAHYTSYGGARDDKSISLTAEKEARDWKKM